MSLYLSQLVLDPRSRQVQSELRDPYQMHRTLSKAFGDDAELYEQARCLFRVDEAQDGPATWVLVQSRVAPDWALLQVSDGYLVSPVKMKEVDPALGAGQRLAFRLRANPTVKRDGKRLGLYREEDQLEWLNRKAGTSGFRLLSVLVRDVDKAKTSLSEGREGCFANATFEGVLEVTDPSAFRLALENGIGSAKGFGFGLLSIAPVR